MELEPTWTRVLKIWWALTWRLLLTTLFAMLIGVASVMLGHALGIGEQRLQITARAVAALTWIATSIIPLKLVLATSFDGFRLVLLPNNVVLPQHDEGQTDTTIRV